MPERLNVSEIASLIGVEEKIIKRTLERRDAALEPYLYEPPHSQSEGKNQTQQIPLLRLEGLPQLITKLSYNIPTSDIIENLACQVMHLVVLRKENAELMGQNQGLQGQNDQYEHRIKDLKQEIEASQAKLTELVEKQSRGWFRNIFKRG